MKLATAPLELLQIAVEHQDIVRTKQNLVELGLSVLTLKTIPLFLVTAIKTIKVSQILLHPFHQSNCSFTSSCHSFHR